jgi:hypothetical protein
MPQTEPQIPGQIPKRRSGNPAWVKGVSGNPAGGLSRAAKQARRDRLVAQIAADLAGGIEALTFTDKLLLDKAVDLLVGHPKSQTDRTRAVNTAARIIETIRRRQAKQASPPGSLQQYIATTYGTDAA